MNLENKKIKILFIVLGIILLVAGLVLMIYGIVNYFVTLNYNANRLSTEEAKPLTIVPVLVSAPFLFLGVFLFVLGAGKKKKVL